MSGVEADLVDDEGLREDYYLDELVGRAPSVDSLIRDVSNLHLFQGFTTYATPDDDAKPHRLSKSEVEAMVNRDFVNWEGLHTDLLAAIFDHRASTKYNAATLCKRYVDRCFKLFYVLAREHPPFLSSASKSKKEMWTSRIDDLAGDFTRLFEERITKGGGISR